MTLEQITAAVDAGKVVHWSNDGYRVIRDGLGQYLIGWSIGAPDEYYIGLTWQDGITLNGAPLDFYEGRGGGELLKEVRLPDCTTGVIIR